MAKAKRGFLLVTGVAELDQKLKALEPSIQKKVLRQAVRAAMKPVLSAARSNAPVKTDELKIRKYIKLAALKRTRRSVLGVEVAVKGSDGTPMVASTKGGKRVFIPYAIEFGHKLAPPHPFMRPAYETKGPAARDHAIRLLREGAEREAKAMGKG